jgi:hypothetical protein
MRKSALAIMLFAGCMLSNAVRSQVSVSVNFNVDAQPAWGPIGYDNVSYYYMPDIEAYYYVPRHQFIYSDGGRWVFATSLPERYHSYDLYRGYKVVVNEPRPYLHHDTYRTRYGHYKGYYNYQESLRDHHEHDEYGNEGPGNGHGQGHAYGHDKGHKDKDRDH